MFYAQNNQNKTGGLYQNHRPPDGYGAPDWDRTSDLQLRKLTLFQLSYGYLRA